MSSADISSAPPIVAAELPPKPTSWPKVVGIIFIVFGALGILQGCFGVVSLFMFGMFSAAIPEEQAQIMDSVEQLQPLMIIGAIISFIIAIILLIAGIGVVSRKVWGRKIALIWAGAKMVFVVFNGVLGYIVQQAQFQAMKEMMENDPNTASSMPIAGSFMTWFAVITIAIAIIWGWALPVFTFIWFSRTKIVNEVASWGGVTNLPPPALSPVPPIETAKPETQDDDKKYWRSDPSD